MCWDITSKCKTSLLDDVILYVTVNNWSGICYVSYQDTRVDLGAKGKFNRLKLTVINWKFVHITSCIITLISPDERSSHSPCLTMWAPNVTLVTKTPLCPTCGVFVRNVTFAFTLSWSATHCKVLGKSSLLTYHSYIFIKNSHQISLLTTFLVIK